jgi:ATP-dependent DNA ligase
LLRANLAVERDMEGIVAKLASAEYTPEAMTWVKIKNRKYSQAVGRADFFDRRKANSSRVAIWHRLPEPETRSGR